MTDSPQPDNKGQPHKLPDAFRSQDEQKHVARMLNIETFLSPKDINITQESFSFPIPITDALYRSTEDCVSVSNFGPALPAVLTRILMTVEETDIAATANRSLAQLDKKIAGYANYAMTFSDEAEIVARGLLVLAKLDIPLTRERAIDLIIYGNAPTSDLFRYLCCLTDCHEVGPYIAKELLNDNRLSYNSKLKNLVESMSENEPLKGASSRAFLNKAHANTFVDVFYYFTPNMLNDAFNLLQRKDNNLLIAILTSLTNHPNPAAREESLVHLRRVDQSFAKVVASSMLKDPQPSVRLAAREIAKA